MNDNASLFKLKAGADDLASVGEFENPMGRHFVFQQTFEGVPVYGGRTSVHFNKAGTIVGVSNNYVPQCLLADLVNPPSHCQRAANGTGANADLLLRRLTPPASWWYYSEDQPL